METETKMGRPPKPKKERRTEFVKARFTPPEYAEIAAAVRAAGESESDWVRKRLLASARRT
jgi:hypothetical protein